MIQKESIFKYIKALGIIIFIVFLTFLTSCGNSSNDEPDESDNSVSVGYLSPAVLPGNWILEDFIPENGKKIDIDYPLTILPFTVKQESDNVMTVANKEIWVEEYNPFIQVSTINGIETVSGIITYTKIKGQPLSTSEITTFGFGMPDQSCNGTYILSLQNMTYKNNILTSEESGYHFYTVDNLGVPQNGKIIMRKAN